MSRWSIAIVLASALAACAPSTHATAYREVAPKTSAEQVEIFTDGKPDRPYEEIGAIEVGRRADIALVDLTGPHCQPLHDPRAALVYSARASDVVGVLPASGKASSGSANTKRRQATIEITRESR